LFEIDLLCPKCKKKYALTDWLKDNCGFRLRINYDLEKRANQVSKSSIRQQPPTHWKYRSFFPLKDPKNMLSLGEGGTPLVRSKRLGNHLGLKNLYLKLDQLNPSGSFKDRPISVGASVALENGATTLSAASSGNAAAALSTYCARAGAKAVVFVPDRASVSKVSQLITLGATVVRVTPAENQEGDPSVSLFQAACKQWGWVPCPSFGPFNPFQFEGTKSLGFEIIEQLNWQVPDWVICNTGSGGLLGGTAAGFFDWKSLDWVDKLPKMVAVQPEACAPVVKAFRDKVSPLEFGNWAGFPDTVAGGLADPHPWDGDTALEMLYETNGAAVSVTDREILGSQQDLASYEGVFGEPSGVAAIAGLVRLLNDGTIDKKDVIVVPVTGHGLKDPQVLQSAYDRAIRVPNSLDLLSAEIKNRQ
jgi:threonine synthase